MLAPILYTSSENKLYPSLPTLPTYGNIPLSGATKLSSGWTAFYLAVLTANIWLAKREFRQSFVPEFACEVFHAIQFNLQGRNGPRYSLRTSIFGRGLLCMSCSKRRKERSLLRSIGTKKTKSLSPRWIYSLPTHGWLCEPFVTGSALHVDYSVQFYLNEKKLPCAEETKRRRGEEENGANRLQFDRGSLTQ